MSADNARETSIGPAVFAAPENASDTDALAVPFTGSPLVKATATESVAAPTPDAGDT